MNSLKIMMLYPLEMNIYGDHGNLEYLTMRAEAYGFKVQQIMYEPGDMFPMDVDIVLGGGGQDSGQGKIMDDLLMIAPKLQKLADFGVPMLMICGLYQMFGHYFLTADGKKIPGIGIFDAYTAAGKKRLIGNVVADWSGYQLVGYENHSGLTHLNSGQTPLAKVATGCGNNEDSGYEGARTSNVIGSYLHGPLLPKNPKLADELIEIAISNKKIKAELLPNEQILELDQLSKKAREVAINRPR